MNYNFRLLNKATTDLGKTNYILLILVILVINFHFFSTEGYLEISNYLIDHVAVTLRFKRVCVTEGGKVIMMVHGGMV